MYSILFQSWQSIFRGVVASELQGVGFACVDSRYYTVFKRFGNRLRLKKETFSQNVSKLEVGTLAVDNLMSTTKISSLFVDSPRSSGLNTNVYVSEYERERRRAVFLQNLVIFSSSFDRSALQILAQLGFIGVNDTLQALHVTSDCGVIVYPSPARLYIKRGDKSCVTVNMTTAKLIAMRAMFLSEVDESVLQAEFSEICRHKTLAVLTVIYCLSKMVQRSRLSPDDGDYFFLGDDEIGLIVPSITFLIQVLKSGHDDILSFSFGAYLFTPATVVALQVGFDMDGREDLVGYPGYAEFARLVSDGVRRCHAGWASENPFIKVDRLIELSRNTSSATRSASNRVDDAQNDELKPKRAKTVGRVAPSASVDISNMFSPASHSADACITSAEKAACIAHLDLATGEHVKTLATRDAARYPPTLLPGAIGESGCIINHLCD